MRYKLTAWTIAALFLTGCAVTPNSEAIGPYPSEFKEIIKQAILETYFDPYSIRSASISAPTQGHIFFEQGWIVCFEANAKNKMGGYTGVSRTAFLINRGRIVKTIEKAALCKDSQATYSKWIEIENLK